MIDSKRAGGALQRQMALCCPLPSGALANPMIGIREERIASNPLLQSLAGTTRRAASNVPTCAKRTLSSELRARSALQASIRHSSGVLRAPTARRASSGKDHRVHQSHALAHAHAPPPPGRHRARSRTGRDPTPTINIAIGSLPRPRQRKSPFPSRLSIQSLPTRCGFTNALRLRRRRPAPRRIRWLSCQAMR